MFFIIFVSLTAFSIAAPCIGLLMLVDATLNPPEHIRTMRQTIRREKTANKQVAFETPDCSS